MAASVVGWIEGAGVDASLSTWSGRTRPRDGMFDAEATETVAVLGAAVVTFVTLSALNLPKYPMVGPIVVDCEACETAYDAREGLWVGAVILTGPSHVRGQPVLVLLPPTMEN